MADAQPTMEMNGAHSAAVQARTPDQQPPDLAGGERRASRGDAGSLRFRGGAGETHVAPALPISGGVAQGVAQGVGTWQNSKKVDALWTINQDGNSWVGIAGIGWKKLAAPNETAVSALTMLVAHARATGSIINYRDESDTLIHEVYVW